MIGKQARQARIRELLQEEAIDTQERLAAVLGRKGVLVSQSTLSKDLREIGVLRVPRADGGFQYMAPDSGATLRDRHILERELRDYLLSVKQARNMLVLHTVSGHAQSVCEAVDRIDWPEVVGTIAGENTIFVATESSVAAAELARRMAAVMGG